MLRQLIRSSAPLLLGCLLASGQNPPSPPGQNSPATQGQSPSAKQGQTPPGTTQNGVFTVATEPAPPGKPLINGLEKRPRMDEHTRMLIIQALNAEFARTRKTFPVGYKDVTLTPDGKIKPDDGRLYQMSMSYGSAAKVGDRIQITNIAIHEKSIYLEINGGPKKKTKWYQHITISGMGGSASAADPNQAQPTGAALTLEFKNYVPEMTGPELKQLLDPVFDFSVRSAEEVYLETVPPKVKAAIKAHEVLVGMNRDMVVMAKDRPPQKTREKDEKGVEYEEWIYGTPPQDVTFIRFVGDEVTQVKIMKITGEKIVKTEKEVDVKDGVASLAVVTAQTTATNNREETPQEPVNRPTLKRPGEADDPAVSRPPTQQRRPVDPTDPSGLPPAQQPPVQTNPTTQPPPN